jgi:hypothetical protein
VIINIDESFEKQSNLNANSLLFSLILQHMDLLLMFVLTAINVVTDANVNGKVIIKQSFPVEFQSFESTIRNHIRTAIKD